MGLHVIGHPTFVPQGWIDKAVEDTHEVEEGIEQVQDILQDAFVVDDVDLAVVGSKQAELLLEVEDSDIFLGGFVSILLEGFVGIQNPAGDYMKEVVGSP